MVKVVILCGGQGSRLRPVTDLIPKALVTLRGKPLLQHLVHSYIDKGYRRFLLCTGYRGDMIMEYFARNPMDAELEYSDAGDGASMLQRLHYAKHMMTDRVFVAYGDTLINVDLDAMLADHLSSGALATITTANVRSPFGLVTFDSDRWIDSFEEKPLQPYFVGHMLLERTLMDGLGRDLLELPDGSGLVKLFGHLIDRRELRTYRYDGPQITFNTHGELDQAERDLVDFFTHQEGSVVAEG